MKTVHSKFINILDHTYNIKLSYFKLKPLLFKRFLVTLAGTVFSLGNSLVLSFISLSEWEGGHTHRSKFGTDSQYHAYFVLK